MDIGMPELNGLDATRQIMRLLPKSEVLIFTADETEEIVRNVFKAGARAYLLKSEANQHLLPAIEALRQHRTYFSSKVSELIFAGYLKGEAATTDPTLTPSERETVQLIAEGKTNKHIAQMLGISVKTVETHRAAIMRKLALESALLLYLSGQSSGAKTSPDQPAGLDSSLFECDLLRRRCAVAQSVAHS